MMLLLMDVERADTVVDCLGRQPLLHAWYLTVSVASTGREIGSLPGWSPAEQFGNLGPVVQN